jgi:tRNA pseudouridine13 synthase
MAPTLTEQQFGITKYLTKSQEFLAIIKHRYSDFHVFEIDLLGKRINLTQTKYIPPIIEPIVTINDEILITDEDKCNKLAIIIDIPNMYELIMSFLAPDSELQYLEILAPAEKDRRTNIHTFIRKNFQGRLGTTFDPKTNQIKIEKFNNKFHKDRVKRLCYKDRGGDYLHFTLYKEEKDTMSIIEYISRVSKIPAKDFNIAGTKDRRAISTQRVSVKKVKAEKLQGLNKILRNARLGNFEYSNEQLNLGDLNGNHFKIAMRSVIGNRDLIENSLKSLQSFGFINYYGMQRFGTRSVSTSTFLFLILGSVLNYLVKNGKKLLI